MPVEEPGEYIARLTAMKTQHKANNTKQASST